MPSVAQRLKRQDGQLSTVRIAVPAAVQYIFSSINEAIADGRQGGRYGLGARPGLHHGDGGSRTAGAERISGRRKPHPEGPVARTTEAFRRRASQARRDRSSSGPQGPRRGRNYG